MRIRLEGRDTLLLREARLSLRVAGFIVVETGDADYVVTLAEAEALDAPVTITGSDGPFERLAINTLAALSRTLILVRADQPNDVVVGIQVPPTDEWRRAMSRALVEMFLSYVSQPTAARPRRPEASPVSPLDHAQAHLVPPPPPPADPTIGVLTHRLVDLTQRYGEAVTEASRAREAAVEQAIVTETSASREEIARVASYVPSILDRLDAIHQRVMAPRPAPVRLARWLGFVTLLLALAVPAGAQTGPPVSILQGGNVAGVTASNELKVTCVSGCSSGTTDTDDGSVAGGQTGTIGINLSHIWDGAVWRRFTVGTAGSASTQVVTIQGIASMTPVLVGDGGAVLTIGQQETATTLGDTVTNAPHVPTDEAVLNILYQPAFLYGFNGTTWDRLRSDTSNGLDVDVTRVGGNVTVVQATGTNLHVVCDSGCTPGGSFADNSAFTFGTTAINVGGAVFDDVAPNAVTENSAAAPRMSSNRVQYQQLRDAAGNERGANVTAGNALVVDGSAVTQPVSHGGLTELAAAINGASQLDVNIAAQAGALTVASHAVTNAGTFAVQVDGAALTALQLIDDAVATDDTTTHTTAVTKGLGVMAVATPTDGAVAANEFGSLAMTLDRKLHVAVMDALPAGTANIGDVDVASIAAGDNNIGNVDIVTLPNVTIGTFPDNEPINVAQMNGVAVTMGNGAAGTGVQRVTLASDSTGNIATIGTSVTPGTAAANLGKAEDASVGSGDTGVAQLIQREDTPTSTASANNEYIAPKANSFGHQFIASICNDPTLTTSVAISQSALNGNAELVALTASQTIYVCGYNFVVSAAASVRLVYGTGTACATGETGITGAYPFAANGGISVASGGAIQTKTAVSNALCIETSAAVNVMGMVTYAKF